MATLQEALDNIEVSYQELMKIANDIMNPITKELSEVIEYAQDNVDTLSIEQIRKLILDLSLKSFKFGDIKEKSLLKSRCAEILKAEAYAREFSITEGSVEAKKNLATLNISSQVVTEALYDLISSLFKTKLDETHRCVDALKSVLMSRMAEQKLLNNFSGESNE